MNVWEHWARQPTLILLRSPICSKAETGNLRKIVWEIRSRREGRPPVAVPHLQQAQAVFRAPDLGLMHTLHKDAIRPLPDLHVFVLRL